MESLQKTHKEAIEQLQVRFTRAFIISERPLKQIFHSPFLPTHHFLSGEFFNSKMLLALNTSP